MYWICFSDSACGMLRLARKDCAPELKPDHILALADDYSWGDLTDVTDCETRAPLLAQWSTQGEPPEGSFDEDMGAYFGALDHVDEAVVWCGANAAEQCGLRYIVSRLIDRGVPIWVADVGEIPIGEIHDTWDGNGPTGVILAAKSGKQLPVPRFLAPLLVRHALKKQAQRRREAAARGEKTRYDCVGEMEAGAVYYFYKRRRLLPQTRAVNLADAWDKLRGENAPLRAMVDGKLKSVSADFYDAVILSCVPAETTDAAHPIGKAIGSICVETGNHVSDLLIFERIRVLAAAKKLEIMRDAPNYRDMTIRKA